MLFIFIKKQTKKQGLKYPVFVYALDITVIEQAFDFTVHVYYYGNNAEVDRFRHGGVLFEPVWPYVFGPNVWHQDKHNNIWPLFPLCVPSVQVCWKLCKIYSSTICRCVSLASQMNSWQASCNVIL